MPVPFRVSGSATPSEKPFKSSTAPLVIEVAPAEDPSGESVALPAAPSFRVPAEMVVSPE